MISRFLTKGLTDIRISTLVAGAPQSADALRSRARLSSAPMDDPGYANFGSSARGVLLMLSQELPFPQGPGAREATLGSAMRCIPVVRGDRRMSPFIAMSGLAANVWP